MIGIYCIKNLIDNKMYIGQSKNIEKRFAVHKSYLRGGYHENEHLQRSWNKYGEENFAFFTLEECKENQINEREIYWISLYDSTNKEHGYNLEGGGRDGKWMSVVSRTKMSQQRRGRVPSVITRKRISEANRGRVYSEDFGRKVSAGKTGKKLSEEHKRKISESNRKYYKSNTSKSKGKKLTEEQKQKLRVLFRGRKHTNEARKKMSQKLREFFDSGGRSSMLGKKQSEETKKKISESLKKNKNRTFNFAILRSPEVNEKRIAGIRKAWAKKKATDNHSHETRQNDEE